MNEANNKCGIEKKNSEENSNQQYNVNTLNSLKKTISNLFHFDIDLNYFVIILVALTQGFTGLSDLALSYLYKDDLKLEPSVVSQINSLVFIPWIIKPVYGLITDSFPIFGYRRKPYLFFFGTLVMISWILMSLWAHTTAEVITIVMITQISTAFCNVIGEALVVETSQRQKEFDPESGSKNVSLYFLIKSIGSLLTAFSSGALLEVVEKRQVFLITAIFPLLLIISAILLDEKKFYGHKSKQHDTYSLKNQTDEENPHYDLVEKHKEIKEPSEFRKQLSLFWKFLKLEIIYKPVIFIFLYMIAPSYGDPLFYFYTNELKFSPNVMGRLKLIYGFASVTGIWVFNRYLRNVSFKKIMWVTTILSMMFNMFTVILVKRINVELGIPDFLFCMTADALTTALAEINTMPLLILACNICPKNIEGTLYAFLMSVINLGSLVSNQLGSSLTVYFGITSQKFNNLATLILVANVAYILPMPSLYLVDDSQYVIQGAKNEEEENYEFNHEEKIKLVQNNEIIFKNDESNKIYTYDSSQIQNMNDSQENYKNNLNHIEKCEKLDRICKHFPETLEEIKVESNQIKQL